MLLISALFLGLAVAQDVTPGDIMPGTDDNVTITGLSSADDDEWVEIANPGMASQDFTFWTLVDEENNTYSFSEGFVLAPGAVVKVHTGQGNDTVNALYWGRDDLVWDDGEVATLVGANDMIVAQYPKSS
ncbi:MAG TPA: lamin tail domain-containing protein [Methanothrix sp.]|nr:lamin tail domain-containing protein [Methanothrix sp.]